MKAAHRHELETNALAHRLEVYIERWKAYTSWIIGGLIALVLVILLASYLRGMSSARSSEAWDTFNHALTSAPPQIDDLHRAVDEVAAGLARVDRRVDESLTKTSIVRYDAYEGTGGHQSASVAVLDGARSGIVLSAIQGRDYARIYLKELEHGRASIALSPEEEEAVERAMSR